MFKPAEFTAKFLEEKTELFKVTLFFLWSSAHAFTLCQVSGWKPILFLILSDIATRSGLLSRRRVDRRRLFVWSLGFFEGIPRRYRARLPRKRGEKPPPTIYHSSTAPAGHAGSCQQHSRERQQKRLVDGLWPLFEQFDAGRQRSATASLNSTSWAVGLPASSA